MTSPAGRRRLCGDGDRRPGVGERTEEGVGAAAELGHDRTARRRVMPVGGQDPGTYGMAEPPIAAAGLLGHPRRRRHRDRRAVEPVVIEMIFVAGHGGRLSAGAGGDESRNGERPESKHEPRQFLHEFSSSEQFDLTKLSHDLMFVNSSKMC